MTLEGRMRDGRFVERRSYDAKRLWAHHHEMIARKAMGETNIEIAQDMGYTPQTVSNIVNSPVGIAKIEQIVTGIDERAMDIAARMKSFALREALPFVEDLISGKLEASPALRARHAEIYLARVGLGPVQKTHSLNERVTKDDLEKLKDRQKAAMESGVIAVGYKEVEE